MDEILKRDQNNVPVMGAVTDDASQNIRMWRVDPLTNRLKISVDGINTNVAIEYVFDGGGAAITPGMGGDLRVPFDMTITSWTIVADQSGSIVVDVLKSDYATFPSVVSIAGSEKPTLSSAQKNQDTNLTTWTTAITAGDIMAFNVDSSTTVQRVTVSINGIRST